MFFFFFFWCRAQVRVPGEVEVFGMPCARFAFFPFGLFSAKIAPSPSPSRIIHQISKQKERCISKEMHHHTITQLYVCQYGVDFILIIRMYSLTTR